MDEPLSNLDAKLRVQMRAELISLHQRLGITTIYVTHDQTEAMTLGDRVVVLVPGVVQQIDTPERLYRQPSNTFVAGFIGSPSMNFLTGRLEQGTVDLGGTRFRLPDRLQRRLDRPQWRRDRRCAPGGLLPRVERLGLGRRSRPRSRSPKSSAPRRRRIFALRDSGIAHLGERSAESADEQQSELSDTLVVRFDSNTDIHVGEHVQLAVNAERVQLFDPGSGDSLLS